MIWICNIGHFQGEPHWNLKLNFSILKAKTYQRTRTNQLLNESSLVERATIIQTYVIICSIYEKPFPNLTSINSNKILQDGGTVTVGLCGQVSNKVFFNEEITFVLGEGRESGIPKGKIQDTLNGFKRKSLYFSTKNI